MNTTEALKAWQANEAARREAISTNRSRLMRNNQNRTSLPMVEVPPKLPHPKVIELYDMAGDWIGTYRDMTEDEARAAAKEEGHEVKKIKWVDAAY